MPRRSRLDRQSLGALPFAAAPSRCDQPRSRSEPLHPRQRCARPLAVTVWVPASSRRGASAAGTWASPGVRADLGPSPSGFAVPLWASRFTSLSTTHRLSGARAPGRLAQPWTRAEAGEGRVAPGFPPLRFLPSPGSACVSRRCVTCWPSQTRQGHEKRARSDLQALPVGKRQSYRGC